VAELIAFSTGFVPATRGAVFEELKGLNTPMCPFSNLPEKQAGSWGQGLTAEKMKECVWLHPHGVARIQFLEWTGPDHLRHTKFAALRDNKDPTQGSQGDLTVCGRYRRRSDKQRIAEAFAVRAGLEEIDFESGADIAPDSVQPVVLLNEDGERQIELMRWAFRIPKKLLFNARSEDIMQAPFWKESFEKGAALFLPTRSSSGRM